MPAPMRMPAAPMPATIIITNRQSFDPRERIGTGRWTAEATRATRRRRRMAAVAAGPQQLHRVINVN